MALRTIGSRRVMTRKREGAPSAAPKTTLDREPAGVGEVFRGLRHAHRVHRRWESVGVQFCRLAQILHALEE